MGEVAYKPPVNVKASQANKVSTFLQPPYEDVGIKYQGYSKTKLAADKWQLNRQETRFYTLGIGSGAFGSTLFNRENISKTFYCTKIIIQWYSISTFSLSLGKMLLADVTGSSASERLAFYPNVGHANIVLDFSDSPRKFSGDKFDLYTQASLGGVDFVVLSLFGWDE